jgi:uncharacterized Zn finger protein (UPF0148 family)
MPTHEFLCRACATLFSKTLTLGDYDVGGVVCPNCRSNDVEQRSPSFEPVTSKKSRTEDYDSREKVNLSASEEDDRARVLSDWEGEGGSPGTGKGAG